MRWANARGALAFVAILAAIALSWRSIESRPVDGPDVAVSPTVDSSTTLVATSTTTPMQAVEAACVRAATFDAEVALIPNGSTPGTLARLALLFWTDLRVIAPEEAEVEVAAVISYYQGYLDTAGPFDFDTERIILEGDKEKFEQLVTRPAPGLQASRDLIATWCQIELPDQPSISSEVFDELEDSLLDPPDEEPSTP